MTKILTKLQFQSEAFKYWAKTGIKYNNYKHYQNFALREKKFKLGEQESTRYIWKTTRDQRVRDEHGKRNNKTYNWKVGLKPGEDYGCRCLAVFVDINGRPTGVVGRARYNSENEALEEEGKNFISSYYGEDRGNGKTHSGVDFAVPEGTVVRATKGGIVDRSKMQYDKDGNETGYGYYVRIKNSDNTFSEYGHLYELSHLRVGDIVEYGDEIGLSGDTGTSTGPHLHYTERDINNNVKEPDRESIEYLLDDFARQDFDN